jgi:AcrR family transcriptional regulator
LKLATPPRRSRQRYNVDTPKRIMAAAARLFSERGYAGVELKDVAAAARVNSASLHYHFHDKRTLYARVIEQALQDREAAVPLEGEREGPQSAAERLRAFIRTLMMQLLDERVPSPMSRLMLWEAIQPTREFHRSVDALPRRQLRILDGIISEISRVAPRSAVRRMSLSVLGQCVYYRYGSNILRRTDPKLSFDKCGLEGIIEHIHRFSLGAIRSYKP